MKKSRFNDSQIMSIIKQNEFGKSGLVYNKPEILSSLPDEEPRDFKAKYFEAKSLDSYAFLITYTTVEDGMSALRSSIWTLVDGRLRILFHQGTEVSNT